MLAQYHSDLAAAAGVVWSKAEASSVCFVGHRHHVYTIPELAPGVETFQRPSLASLGIRASTSVSRSTQRAQLLATFDRSVATEQWALALRCAIVAELIRRTAQVHTARGDHAMEEFRVHGGLYETKAPLPPPPAELRPVFHGLSYGGQKEELVFMQAVGVRPLPRSTAGFEPVAPLHVVVRAYNNKTKRPVHVPAVVAKAWLALPDQPIEAVVRRCRPLVEQWDAAAVSPLGMLELEVLACIPSGVLDLSDADRPRYEHLFGVTDDTRRFWLTAHDTDRRQFPCAVVLPPEGCWLPPFDPIEPLRLQAMRALRAHTDAEEKAMFQVMLGVWGIDRLIVGRRLVWREAPGHDANDDLSVFDSPIVGPQWLPQRLLQAIERQEDAEPEPLLLPTKSKRAYRPAIRCANEPEGRRRSFRGSGRLQLHRDEIVDWAIHSLRAGGLNGGTCASVCVQDPRGARLRSAYNLTPGIVVGLIDTIVHAAVDAVNEARSSGAHCMLAGPSSYSAVVAPQAPVAPAEEEREDAPQAEAPSWPDAEADAIDFDEEGLLFLSSANFLLSPLPAE
jgi:hypothetical protein